MPNNRIAPLSEPPAYGEILYARGRLSLAQMYMRDLEGDADFGRMVDDKGVAFNCSRTRWIEIVRSICNETESLLPAQSYAMRQRVDAYAEQTT